MCRTQELDSQKNHPYAARLKKKKKKKGNFFLVCSLPIRRDARNIRTDMAVPADSPEQLQDSEFFKDVGWRYSLEYSVRQKHK